MMDTMTALLLGFVIGIIFALYAFILVLNHYINKHERMMLGGEKRGKSRRAG
jgi:heme/copper-type cytochrome/quinol oxidase subunit 4